MNFKHLLIASVFAPLACHGAFAGVTAEEAAKLKTTLTPLGAERAGNADGSIPAWDGGYTTVAPGWKNGDARPDPFAAEKPLYAITAANVGQYANLLSDGDKMLFQKYSTYRIDVYPTHRTAAAPQWYYDNTAKNAVNASLENNGQTLKGAYGGKPFPIPKTGNEVLWNHTLQWSGEAVFYEFRAYVVPSDGKIVLATQADQTIEYPYHLKNGQATWTGDHWWHVQKATGPSFKAGESLLIIDNTDWFNHPRQAWQYLTGQHRVRKAPTVGFDTPDFVMSGVGNFDEAFVWLGSPERYDWKLIGKQEMIIPYNNNKIVTATPEQVFLQHHLNPDIIRFEKHRVWVVEATLAEGKRHVVPKRRYYFDEDTGEALLGDSWDAQGNLWKHNYGLTLLCPDIPAVLGNVDWGIYNFQTGAYVLNIGLVGSRTPVKTIEPPPANFFSPDLLAGEAVR